MTTTISSREIKGYLQEAKERALNLYWKCPTGCPTGRPIGYALSVRIIRARTRKGAVQVLSLQSGEWYTVHDGDAFYIQ